MIGASFLELFLFAILVTSHDPRTRVVGVIAWTVYLRYSALRSLFEYIAEWWDDRNDPPDGAA